MNRLLRVWENSKASLRFDLHSLTVVLVCELGASVGDPKFRRLIDDVWAKLDQMAEVLAGFAASTIGKTEGNL